MRFVMLLAALGIAAILAGCVPSLHQAYTDKDVVLDKALLGTWAEESDEEGPGEIWIFKEGEDGAYDLTVTSDGEPGEFEGHLVRLGGASFLDMYPKGAGNIKNTLSLLHLIRAHTFPKIKIEGDVLHILMLDPDWLAEAIDDGKVKIAHEHVTDDLVLTASTEELQKFLAQYAENEEPFLEFSILRRQAEASPAEP